MSPTVAPDPAELVAWYADMGITEALDEAPHDHFAQQSHVAQPSPSAKSASDAPRPRPMLPPRAGQAPVALVRPDAAAATAPDDAAVTARAMAREAATLDALKEALSRFEGCALKATAKNLVFADGNPEGRVMIVGEAPGADEDRVGLPFVGRSGQLLDRMLAAIGLSRKTDVYIANVVPWRPPGNRTPTPQEAAICLPFIQRQIQLADPDILLCLGAPSAMVLLGFKGITASRGKWADYDTGTRTIRAIASLHPAYLLRQPLQKRLAWRDMRALKAALGNLP